MTVLFEKEMENLKKLILTEGSLVEEAIARAIQAFLNRDVDQAQAVIRDDRKLDRMEIDVEEECLKILALHHPVPTICASLSRC
jgi:phosphate transport system protein